jgi:hypothetical protein
MLSIYLMANLKIGSDGRVIRGTGFYLVKCKCHTFHVQGGPDLWNVINGFQRCFDCQRMWKAAEIFGRKSDHECGPKCRNSKGPNCECSCAGKNHGRGYAV